MKPYLVAKQHHLEKLFLNSGVTPDDLLKKGIIQKVDDLGKVNHDKLSAALIGVTREPISDDQLMDLIRIKNLNMTPDEYRKGAEKYFGQSAKDAMQGFRAKELVARVAKKLAEEK
jgi:hypothetical protein